jgi:molybdopterin synthase sulfur carrier subunit
MPRIVFSGTSCLPFTNGETEFDVNADTFRRLIHELNDRFPGLGTQVEEGMAIAIDGEIYQDAYSVALKSDSEIYIIPKISGG